MKHIQDKLVLNVITVKQQSKCHFQDANCKQDIAFKSNVGLGGNSINVVKEKSVQSV